MVDHLPRHRLQNVFGYRYGARGSQVHFADSSMLGFGWDLGLLRGIAPALVILLPDTGPDNGMAFQASPIRATAYSDGKYLTAQRLILTHRHPNRLKYSLYR